MVVRLFSIKIICFLLVNAAMIQANQPPIFITEDHQKGERLSRENRLPMVLVFTGSDWSKSSEQFLCEWLFHSDTWEEVRNDFIFTWIDFPQLNTKPFHLVERNHALKERFQITNFPTLVLLDHTGQEITRLGYPISQEGGLSAAIKEKFSTYVDLLEKWDQVRESHNEELLEHCYQKALTLGQSILITDMISFAVEEELCAPLLFEHYVNLVNQGEKNRPETRQIRQVLLRQDPSNSKGFREKVALFDFQEQNNPFALETVLQQFCSHQSENFWKIHLILSEQFFQKGNAEEALEHAKVSYQHAPTEKKGNVSELIQQISMKKAEEYPSEFQKESEKAL